MAAEDGLSPAAVLAGRTELAGLAATVAGAALLVCAETGVGHLATALGTPSVLRFGPTPPMLWRRAPSRQRPDDRRTRAAAGGRAGDNAAIHLPG